MQTVTNTLADTGTTLLTEAHDADSGRAARTLIGGSGHLLRQTLIALCGGDQLAEHASPGEASLQVLQGVVQLHAGTIVERGWPGDLLVIPSGPHSLLAIEDAVVLLTVARCP